MTYTFYSTLEKTSSVRLMRAMQDAMSGDGPSKKSLSLLRKRGIIDSADDLEGVQRKVQDRMDSMGKTLDERLSSGAEMGKRKKSVDDHLDDLIARSQSGSDPKSRKKLRKLKARRKIRRRMERGKTLSDVNLSDQGRQLNKARAYTNIETALKRRTNTSQAREGLRGGQPRRAQNLDNYITEDMSDKQIENRLTTLIGRTTKRGAERKEALEDLRYGLQNAESPAELKAFIEDFTKAQRGTTAGGAIRSRAEYNMLGRPGSYGDYDAQRASGKSVSEAKAYSYANKPKPKAKTKPKSEPKIDPQVIGSDVPKPVVKESVPEIKSQVIGSDVPKPMAKKEVTSKAKSETPTEITPEILATSTPAVKSEIKPEIIATPTPDVPVPPVSAKRGVNPYLLSGGVGLGAFGTGYMAGRRKNPNEEK